MQNFNKTAWLSIAESTQELLAYYIAGTTLLAEDGRVNVNLDDLVALLLNPTTDQIAIGMMGRMTYLEMFLDGLSIESPDGRVCESFYDLPTFFANSPVEII